MIQETVEIDWFAFRSCLQINPGLQSRGSEKLTVFEKKLQVNDGLFCFAHIANVLQKSAMLFADCSSIPDLASVTWMSFSFIIESVEWIKTHRITKEIKDFISMQFCLVRVKSLVKFHRLNIFVLGNT